MHSPKSPPSKQRSFTHLTLFDRITLEIRWKEKKTYEAIGLEINRPRSAVYREIQKNLDHLGRYKADTAHRKALAEREKRGRRQRLKSDFVEAYVIEKLKLGWSPEQISLRLPLVHTGSSISHEAIYQYIYSRIHRGGNGKVKKDQEDLRPLLARRHKRRAKKGFRKAQKLERRGKLPSIEQRPKVVERRKEVGHWEDDTMVSRASPDRLKTINERVSGVVRIGKTIDGTTASTNAVVLEKLSKIPPRFRKTLTRDRGSENFDYLPLERELSLRIYFAHAYASYERGSNENLNGLIRRYFPKKTDFSKVTDEEVQRVEDLLNDRPRKRHGGLTPNEVFFKLTSVALIR